jgi:integrase
LILKQIDLASGVEFFVNNPPANLFDQFLQERRYLKNVTEPTLVWYRVAFRNWQALHPACDPPPLPTKATLQQFVIALRDRGIRPVTCNTYIGAMNAFCRWLSEEGHVRERVKLGKLRVERRLLTLLDEAQMRALIGFKPKTFRQVRVHLATLLILDTGLRISEALHLLASDIDFDNLVLKVFGKGQKERLVPFPRNCGGASTATSSSGPRRGSRGSSYSPDSKEPGGRSGTVPARCIGCRTGWVCRGLAGTGCGTRLPQITSGTVGTSCVCQWCSGTHRLQRLNATCTS